MQRSLIRGPGALFVAILAAATLTLFPSPLHTQDGASLDLTINDVGISIGDSPRVIGLRLNFRDRRLQEVIGANVTIWTPYEYTGVVRGLALGLPATGARQIDGVGVGIFGVGAGESIRGIAAGGLGVGAGSSLTGIGVGGLGVGVGGSLGGIAVGGFGTGVGENATGLVIGGLGTGIGSSLRGIAVGGLGTGVGENATGLVVGVLGAGVGGDMRGISFGGLGLGVGGRLQGISMGGLGVGAGGDATGVHLAGVGIGAGGTLRGVSVAGIGIGAGAIEGIALAPAVGTGRSRALVVAPAYFRIADGGSAAGVNISAFNDVRGTQHGLAIGIFNYARQLDGLQVGVLNYAGNKPPATRLLPLLNFARSR